MRILAIIRMSGIFIGDLARRPSFLANISLTGLFCYIVESSYLLA